MRNKLLTFAGALALLAVLGKFYAPPLLAQVRAALVQDRDNPARQPFSFFQTVGFSVSGIIQLPLPSVPAGKRRIINGIYGTMISSGNCTVDIESVANGTTSFQATFAAIQQTTGLVASGSLTPMQMVMNPGDLGFVDIFCPPNPTQRTVAVTGYDIDIP